MAITGTLVADFSSFYDAAAKAETSLKGMETAAAKTGKSLTNMADGVDTSAAVADVEKLRAGLDKLGSVTVDTVTPATKSLSAEVDGADKLMKQFGVSLGPLSGMLDQLAAATGISSDKLVLLGKAFLVVEAAKAGWNVGRQIAELGGLDEKIAELTASLMGWGDVAAVEAASAADVLAKASRLAGYEITNLSTAVKINAKAAADQRLETEAAGKELEKLGKEADKAAQFSAKLFSQDDIERAWQYVTALNGVENVSQLTTDKKKELKKAVDEAIDAYHALGEHAPKALRDISAATTPLIEVTKSFSATTSTMWTEFRSQAQAGGETIAQVTERAKTHWTDLGGVTRDELVKTAAEALNNYEVALAASENFTGKQIADFRTAAAEAQAAVDAWGTDTIEAYDAIAAASTQTAALQIANNARVVSTVVSSWTDAMSAVSAGLGTMSGTVVSSPSPANRAATLQAWNEGNYYGPVVGGTPQNPRGTGPDWYALGYRAAGGPVSAGQPYVVGERGPELMIPSSAGRVAPAGSFGGGVVVNISTVMGDPHAIARLVSQALVDTARSRGARLPVGV
jgi:hypothetical protein